MITVMLVYTKKVLRIITGIILVIVGLIALFTPITPGSWLALIGLELLGFGFLLPKRWWKKDVGQ